MKPLCNHRDTSVLSVIKILPLLAALLLAVPLHGQRLRQLWPGLGSPQPQSELPRGNTPAQTPERVPKKEVPTTFTQVGETKAEIGSAKGRVGAISGGAAENGGGEWIFTSGWEMASGESVIASGGGLFDPSLDTSDWYNATVPGTVLTTLVEQGVWPDPFFGLNNMAIPDTLSRMEWWYRNVFELPARAAEQKRIRLALDGVNYMAEVWLNGHRLGTVEGAFTRGGFDITEKVLRQGENVLAVRIIPPRNPGIPHEQSMAAGQGLNGGALSLDGPTFISSMGWDWIPAIRDRNIGIWQNVRLLAGGDALIGDPLVITRLPYLPDTTRAALTIMVPVHNDSAEEISGRVRITSPLLIEQEYRLAAGESAELLFTPEEYPQLNIKNPRLWWPNGYGNPELYTLNIELLQDSRPAGPGEDVHPAGPRQKERLSDSKSLRFGIRELSYELMVAQAGNAQAGSAQAGNAQAEDEHKRVLFTPAAAVKPSGEKPSVSRKPVFDYLNRAKYSGSNQLPTFAPDADMSAIEPLPADDPVGPYLAIRVNGVRIFCRGGNWGMDDGMKRSSPERLEPYLRLHREAGFNIIRNWTGESTQESFYDLCDRYGMLVWNDFWITTDDTVEPLDVELFMRNARDVVRRYRNHPSIAIWCPRNEGFAPANMEALLPAMMAAEDPTRHYHGQSRFLNMDGSGPWGYYKEPAKYYTDNARGFITEIGTYAIPTASTLRKFIGEADLWPINDVWAYHDLHHTTQNFPDFMAAVERYGEPEGMEDFSRKAQQVCYDAWRAIMEAWNSRMWNSTTGQILWMSHPAWPSMIWQTYTYDYETPGSYFGARKACEPLHVQMNLDDGKVVIINSTREPHRNLTVKAEAIDPSTGKVFYRESGRFNAEANSLTSCFTAGFPDRAAGNLPERSAKVEVRKDADGASSGLYMIRVTLGRAGRPISVNDYWMASSEADFRQMDALAAAQLKTTLKKSKQGYTAEVVNHSEAIAIGVKLNAVARESGEIILPAYFSDGYFNLLPHEKRTIELELPEGYADDFEIVTTIFNN